MMESRVFEEITRKGNAILKGVMSEEECQLLAGSYPEDDLFRSRVVMARHGFGRGEYKYFKYPLPEIVNRLRTELYPGLASIANAWNECLVPMHLSSARSRQKK